VQKALELITQGTMDLQELIDKSYEEGFKFKLNDYVMLYAKLNYDFSSYLIMKITEAYYKDKDDKEFDDLMKGLE